MNFIKMSALIFVFVISLAASQAMAQDNSSMAGHDHMNHDTAAQESGHDSMDHSSMGHEMAGNHEAAEGVGVVHRVSKLNRTVNLTHEPIPSLKWPAMTMDLPVAKSVDIGGLKSGDKIKFKLELGADKKYTITHIEK